MTPQTKITKNLHEIKTIVDDSDKKVHSIHALYARFTTLKLKKHLDSFKEKGFSVKATLFDLLIMTITNQSVRMYVAGDSSDAAKDTYYRLKNEPRVDWRMVMFLFVNRFVYLVNQSTTEVSEEPRCLVIDDTSCFKRGKFIEGISKIFDHVFHRYCLGFKGLIMGYCDSKSFIPVDFSLHNEKGKRPDKPFGLKPEELNRQFTKERQPDCPGYTRETERRISKSENTIAMIKRALRHRLQVDYILVDSWFMNLGLISYVYTLKSTYLLGMCKFDDRKYIFKGKEKSVKQLLDWCKRNKKIKRSRTIKARYAEMIVEYKGYTMKLFFSQFNDRSWNVLITDNRAMTFAEAIKIYTKRWSIEVFFKETKQHLGLGKDQSRDFDAQIASFTCVFLVYIMVSLRRRFNAYESMGVLFRKIESEILETTLTERLWGLFIELQHSILQVMGVSFDELIEMMLCNDQVEEKMIGILMEMKSWSQHQTLETSSHLTEYQYFN
jgi:hypothetical protein